VKAEITLSVDQALNTVSGEKTALRSTTVIISHQVLSINIFYPKWP
jgi:hypothetical protein